MGWKALVAGLVGGGVVVGLLAATKAKELEARGNRLAATLQGRGTELEAYLTSQGEDIERELETLAQREAERVAKESADRYMADVYGLTPARIERIGLIARYFGG